MNLIMLFGSEGVGKMTVGQELMKITDYRLFHNHMIIEPVLEVFGAINTGAIKAMRDIVFDEFIKTDNIGLIFTFMWAFDIQEDWDYIRSISERFEASGGEVYYVELIADQKTRLARNRTENRMVHKASEHDITFSETCILSEDAKYRLVSNEGELLFKHYIKIDNSNIEPSTVAQKIKDFFALPDKRDCEGIYRNDYIKQVQQDFCKKEWSFPWEGFETWYSGNVHVDCSCTAETIIQVINKSKVYEDTEVFLREHSFATANQIYGEYLNKLCEILDDDFHEYAQCDDYYPPVGEDYAINYSDIVERFCNEHGFEIISCQCDGETSDYEQNFGQRW